MKCAKKVCMKKSTEVKNPVRGILFNTISITFYLKKYALRSYGNLYERGNSSLHKNGANNIMCHISKFISIVNPSIPKLIK